MQEQGYEQLTLFPEDSPANRTASSENVWQKRMKDIYGQSLCGSSESLDRGMLLEKMLMASYQQYMSPFAPTWKEKTTKSGRTVYRLVLSERIMRDTGFALLASPRASQDFKPIRKPTPSEKNNTHGKALCASLGIIFPECTGQYINPHYAEWLMGFPIGWGISAI